MMSSRTRVLIAGRDENALNGIRRAVEECFDAELMVRTMRNGHADPLHEVVPLPDALILQLDQHSTTELEEFLRRPVAQRCPLIVVGPSQDPELMRRAMHAGARDFLAEPISASVLAVALERVCGEREVPGQEDRQLVAFVNAKGGVGSSFLAANFAHACRESRGIDTVLLDLDRHFATLAQYLDIKVERGLSDAVSVADQLDAVALDAFLARHVSGLRFMGERLDLGAIPGLPGGAAPSVEAFLHILTLLDDKFTRIVADVPRNLDPLGVATLERADHVVLVMQQSIPCIRDAVRLKQMLTQALGIEPKRLRILVNRYASNSPASLDDIRDALELERPILVPNHFPSVSRSVDTGVPISEGSPSSPVTKSLRALDDVLNGHQARPLPNIFARSISSLLRS